MAVPIPKEKPTRKAKKLRRMTAAAIASLEAASSGNTDVQYSLALAEYEGAQRSGDELAGEVTLAALQATIDVLGKPVESQDPPATDATTVNTDLEARGNRRLSSYRRGFRTIIRIRESANPKTYTGIYTGIMGQRVERTIQYPLPQCDPGIPDKAVDFINPDPTNSSDSDEAGVISPSDWGVGEQLEPAYSDWTGMSR